MDPFSWFVMLVSSMFQMNSASEAADAQAQAQADAKAKQDKVDADAKVAADKAKMRFVPGGSAENPDSAPARSSVGRIPFGLQLFDGSANNSAANAVPTLGVNRAATP